MNWSGPTLFSDIGSPLSITYRCPWISVHIEQQALILVVPGDCTSIFVRLWFLLAPLPEFGNLGAHYGLGMGTLRNFTGYKIWAKGTTRIGACVSMWMISDNFINFGVNLTNHTSLNVEWWIIFSSTHIVQICRLRRKLQFKNVLSRLRSRLLPYLISPISRTTHRTKFVLYSFFVEKAVSIQCFI